MYPKNIFYFFKKVVIALLTVLKTEFFPWAYLVLSGKKCKRDMNHDLWAYERAVVKLIPKLDHCALRISYSRIETYISVFTFQKITFKICCFTTLCVHAFTFFKKNLNETFMNCQFQEWLVNMISVCAEGFFLEKNHARGSIVSASDLQMCERADEVNHYLISLIIRLLLMRRASNLSILMHDGFMGLVLKMEWTYLW